MEFSIYQNYTMALAALAIRGHKSAHSFATGPVMADPVIMTIVEVSGVKNKLKRKNGFLPFISPFGFTMTPALSETKKKSDKRAWEKFQLLYSNLQST